MREINEVIREKEAELARINEELAALRLTLRLLSEESGEKPGFRDESVIAGTDQELSVSTLRLSFTNRVG